MKNVFLLFILLLSTALLIGQSYKRDYQWRFGNRASLSFSSGAPVSLTGSAMVSSEGSTTISDTFGNLLFYTNGNTVWDANNNIMPNGTGLLGSSISDQSALVVPMPGNSNLFYVFTIPNWTGPGDGLTYSIIDMTLNGGMGDVTATKNVQVNTNGFEQVSAIISADGQKIWIISHEYNNQNFDAYGLTASGLNTVPVVSTIGMVYSGDNRFGQMHFSSDCNPKLVSVLGTADAANETVQLFDFNISTGVVSNVRTLATVANIQGGYSAAFSPDNTKLYVTAYNGSYVDQFDLTNANIASTLTNIATGNTGTTSSVCQGPDGKLYVNMSGQAFLSVIQSPNMLGAACNFQYAALSLVSGSCALTSPNFPVQIAYPLTVNIDTISAACGQNNGSVIAVLDSTEGPFTYAWNTGGSTDTLNHLAAGTYSVTVNGSFDCSGSATAVLNSQAAAGSPTITISGNNSFCSQTTATFNATITNGGANPTYEWRINGNSVGTNSSSFSYANFNSGDVLTCEVVSSITCLNPDSAASNNLVMAVSPSPSSVFTATTPVCAGQNSTVTYSGAPSGTASYVWVFNGASVVSGSGLGPYQINWSQAGNKILTLVVTDHGCTSVIDTFDVMVNPNPVATFNITSPVCLSQNALISFTDSASQNAIFNWNFSGGNITSGSGAGPYQVSWPTTGSKTVSLSITDGACVSNDTSATVLVNAAPVSNAGANVAFCSSDSAVLGTASTVGYSYIWTPTSGLSNSAISNPFADATNISNTVLVTKYFVTTGLGACSNTDSVTVTVYPVPEAKFSVTSPVCLSQNALISFTGSAAQNATFNWNFSGGNVISGSGAGPYQVSWPTIGAQTVSLSITEGTCVSNDTSATVMVNPEPVSTAGPDVAFCWGDSAALGTASTAGYSYAWTPTSGLSNSAISNPFADATNTSSTPLVTKYFVTTSLGACSGVDSVTVTVNPMPVATFNVTSPVCLLQNALVSFTGSAPQNATFNWNFSGGNVISGSGAGPYEVSWATTGAQSVSLSITAGSCVSNDTSVTVLVNAVPVSNAGANVAFCSGDSAPLGTSPTTGYSYIWTLSLGLSNSLISNPFADATNISDTALITKYFVTTSLGQCSSTDSVTVTVYPVPVVSFVVPVGECFKNNNFSFVANGSYLPGATFNWNFGINGMPSTSTFSNQVDSFSAPGVQTVSLTVTQGGCPATFTDTVEVYAMPVADFKPGAALGCSNTPICFVNNSISDNPSTCQWFFGDGNSSSLQSPCHIYLDAGTFTVKLIVQSVNGCLADTIKRDVLSISPSPIAAFIPVDATIQLPDDTISLYNESSNATSYSWNFGVLGNSTDLNPSLTFTYAGVYQVLLLASNALGCVDSVEHEIIVLPPDAFFIPNVFTPNGDGHNDEFYIEAQEGVTVIKFLVFDRWGEKVHDGAYPWNGTYRGKLCPPAVYVYYFQLGLAGQNNGLTRNGSVTLLR